LKQISNKNALCVTLTTDKMKSITLVGGGLAGSLVSVYLAKRGYEVNIYERRPDMRNVEIPAGRSINLALSTRGISALKKSRTRPSGAR